MYSKIVSREEIDEIEDYYETLRETTMSLVVAHVRAGAAFNVDHVEGFVTLARRILKECGISKPESA